MAEHREQRYSGRHDPRGFGERGYEEHGGRQRHEQEYERSFGGFGKGSARDRMGAEQFRSQDEFGGHGEQDYRDFGRGQPGGSYEHSGQRDYRHGSGYGGFGQSPGESGGGFGSGRSYAAEPGWGPEYGQQQYGQQGGFGARGYEGQGSYQSGYYGPQPGFGGQSPAHGFNEPGRFSGHRGQQSFSGQGYGHSGMGSSPSGQSFGEAGHSYGQQGFGQSQYGYGGENWQEGSRRHHGRGPKGYQRSDERLKEDISERLMSAAYVDASEVSVEVKDGKVTLEGSVHERRMKHCIEDIVDDCMGVKDIDNRIRVSQGQQGAETSMSIGGGTGAGMGQGSGQQSGGGSGASGGRSK